MSKNKINIEVGATDATRGVFGGIKGAIKSIGASLATYLSARAVIGFVKKTVGAFMEQEQALSDLAAAFDNSGAKSAEMVPRIQKLSSAIQRLTVHGDEGIQSVAAYGLNLGVTSDQIEQATIAAVGLAAKLRVDVKTAMMLVARASQGNTAMFTRYGIKLDETMTKTEQYNTVLKIGASNFVLATRQAETNKGVMQQLSGAYNDVSEKIGESIVKTTNFTESLTDIKDALLAIADLNPFDAIADDLSGLTGFIKTTKEDLAGVLAVLEQMNRFSLVNVMKDYNKIVGATFESAKRVFGGGDPTEPYKQLQKPQLMTQRVLEKMGSGGVGASQTVRDAMKSQDDLTGGATLDDVVEAVNGLKTKT